MAPETSIQPGNFEVPYPRPEQLSDPFDDFTPELLDEILATPDERFPWHHFRNVLGPFLPAGTYEESVYFLPRAFKHIIRHDDHALDMITSLVWFVSEYADNLANDDLLASARDSLLACLERWTSAFEVVHFNREACKAKGWGLQYFDLVNRSEVVCEATCDLVRFERHSDIAESFVQYLATQDGQPVKAAWFLEYARAQGGVYHPPDHPPIRRLLSDRTRLDSAARLVRSTLALTEESPTYWTDAFKAVGL